MCNDFGLDSAQEIDTSQQNVLHKTYLCSLTSNILYYFQYILFSIFTKLCINFKIEA